MKPGLMVALALLTIACSPPQAATPRTARPTTSTTPSPGTATEPVTAGATSTTSDSKPEVTATVRVVNRLAPLHLDRCSPIEGDAAYRLPPGARVTVLDSGPDNCKRVRITIPTEGEVTGLVSAARLSAADGWAEPDVLAWANANPALDAKPEIAAAKEELTKRIADEDDLKRWEKVRMTAFCPDPKIDMGVVAVTTGDDKMRAALAFATCNDEPLRERASQLLDAIAAQCFQSHEWQRNCPRRASVDDQRRRLAQPAKAK